MVFGSSGIGNNGFSGITGISAIPKLKFYIKKVQFSGVADKMAIPTDPVLPKTSVLRLEGDVVTGNACVDICTSLGTQ